MASDSDPMAAAGGDARLAAAMAGDGEALAALFAQYRDRLRRTVSLRMDRRLHGRVDPSDVLQEAYVDVSRRVGQYAADPRMPFHLWLRFLVVQKLMQLHRHHLGAQRRAAGMEVAGEAAPAPGATAVGVVEELLGSLTSPSRAAVREETRRRLVSALEAMDPVDREVLTLRHFEELRNEEVAEVLGLSKSAASNRYIRALKRLREILTAAGPGLMEP
jgi:RNA polymerase sigma-70 factor (ECF subfamily)